MLWRRSYATPPPEIDPNDQYAQNNDPRYAGDPVPEAECLANVVERVKPYFESAIEPELKAGKTVLIAAHGNSLRAIVKMLDNLSEEEIAKVNIPTAIPLLYELDENFKPIKPRGEYLDPEAAAAGAAAVAAGPEVSLSRNTVQAVRGVAHNVRLPFAMPAKSPMGR